MNCPPCSGGCNQGRECPDRPIATPLECQGWAAVAVGALVLAVVLALFFTWLYAAHSPI